MREWMPLDVLNWFGRGNELHTPKSFQFVREGLKSWALSMVPHFSLSPPRFAFLAWGDYTCSRFARSTIPAGNMGTTCSLCFFSFTETNRWTCLNSICTLSSGSQMLKHVPNFRPFYLFYLFFFLESRISQLMSQYWKLLSGASAIYHSNFTFWPLSNVILKQNWVRMKAS